MKNGIPSSEAGRMMQLFFNHPQAKSLLVPEKPSLFCVVNQFIWVVTLAPPLRGFPTGPTHTTWWMHHPTRSSVVEEEMQKHEGIEFAGAAWAATISVMNKVRDPRTVLGAVSRTSVHPLATTVWLEGQ